MNRTWITAEQQLIYNVNGHNSGIEGILMQKNNKKSTSVASGCETAIRDKDSSIRKMVIK